MSTLPPIAVVGIHAELPSGSYSHANLDYDAFIQFLLDKGEAYERIPPDRFNIDVWRGRGIGQVLPELGVFLKDSTAFDPLEFGITSKDASARAMSVSTRKLVEASFLALLDSGINYRGRDVGCYVAGIAFDINSIADPDEFEARGSFAGIPCMLANRVSYHLDLLGPSLQTDTACSSTLTALHLAIQGIRNHDCESAVVAGCQLNHRLIDFIQYSQGSLVAEDGKSKPFDAAANGFSRGEGVVAIVLKPLDDAIRDGDRIYASILGTGINNTGGSAPAGAPVASGQIQAMLKAYKDTGRTPAEANYVELHATGTAAGDPVEANWVGEYFQRKHPILIGSVKANIGHLEITAFLASLCKICGMFQTGTIPPAVNLTTLNPAIKWDAFGLRVPTIATPLPSDPKTGLPLVSLLSSGIGGSNGHCVVEAPPRHRFPVVEKSQGSAGPVLLVAGGLSPRSAASIADDLIRCVETEVADLKTLSTLYGRRGRQMPWRSFAVTSTSHNTPLEFKPPTLVSRMNSPVVFVLSGQGPQHLEMGRQLYQYYPDFRTSILAMDDLHRTVVGVSLVETTGLFQPSTTSDAASSIHDQDVWPIAITLPAIAMIQLALIDLLQTIGVRPEAVIGHSAGEIAMMYASGFCSREMAFELAIARGQAMALTESVGGSMIALGCGPAQAEDLIAATWGNSKPRPEIACFNSANAVTVAGLATQLEKLLVLAQDAGIFARQLRTRTPVHSSLMDTCRERYLELVERVFARYPKSASALPKTRAYSTLTGTSWMAPFTPEYCWEITRMPVLFSDSLSALLRDIPSAIFVEISPHPVLAPYLTAMGAPSDRVLCPMKRQKKWTPDHELSVLLNCLGRLMLLGCNDLDFGYLNRVNISTIILSGIPAYPFAKKDIPYHPASSSMIVRQKGILSRPLNRPNLKINALTHPALAQHVIAGESIMPATGYLEMVFEHGARTLRNITFRSMMPLSTEKLLKVEFEVNGTEWRILSTLDGPPDSRMPQVKNLHVEGLMTFPSSQPIAVAKLDLLALKGRLEKADASRFYDHLQYFAQYGPLYQRTNALYIGENEALVQITGTDAALRNADFAGYVTNPILLDACCHVLVHPAMTANADRNIYYLPDYIGTVDLLVEDFSEREIFYVYIHLGQWNPDSISFDVTIADQSGTCLCRMVDFRVARHELSIALLPTTSYDMMYQPLGLQYSVPLTEILNGKADEAWTPSPSVPDAKSTAITILTFRFGKEFGELRNQLLATNHQPIWIAASDNTDVAAAQGFVRSIRGELPEVKLRLVAFHETWDAQAQKLIIHFISEQRSSASDTEFFVDSDGTIMVPRLIASERLLQSAQSINWDAYWILEDNVLRFRPLPPVQTGWVLIRVDKTSASTITGLCAVSGCIVRSGFDVLKPHTSAIAFTGEACSSYVLVHYYHVIPYDSPAHVEDALQMVVPVAVLADTVGIASLLDSVRVKRYRILLLNDQSIFAGALEWVLTALGLTLCSVSASTSFENLRHAACEHDIIFSGEIVTEGKQSIQCAVPKWSRVIFWHDVAERLRFVCGETDRWLFSDAVRDIIPMLLSSARQTASCIPAALSPREGVSTSHIQHEFCFDPSRSYLLVGGIGSLGMRLALWMYTKGARYLTLTSRHGEASLSRGKDALALRILSYLRKQPGVQVTLANCDSTRVAEMSKLKNTMDRPLAGCFLLAAVLQDRLFKLHTEDSYYEPFPAKIQSFRNVEQVFSIPSLDFLVAVSSIATFGNPGQTNYASANAIVDELTRPYPNAFSLIAPAILDSSMIVGGVNLEVASNLSHLESWGMTSQVLFNCVEDGLLKLSEGPFWLYVPQLKWTDMRRNIGSSNLYEHLCAPEESVHSDSLPTREEINASMLELLLRFLDVSRNDFLLEVPFTSYGLDSLSAGRLSVALQPFLSVTQLQLLGHMTFVELEARVHRWAKEATADHARKQRSAQIHKPFKWDRLNQSGENVVVLVDGTGIPLILIHGFSGNIVAFMQFQERFSTPLWAIQTTPETPLDSVATTAKYYVEQIKIARPRGPYRIGGFSASSLLTFEVAKLLESEGEILVQLAMLDHFPTLFTSPSFELDDISLATGQPSRAVVKAVVQSICECYLRDNSPARHDIARELQRAVEDLPVREYIDEYMSVVKCMTAGVTRFLVDIAGRTPSRDSVREALIARLKTIKSPVAIYVASRGMRPSIPASESKGWEDLGCSDCFPSAKVISFDSSHFDLFEKEVVVQSLEKDWLVTST